MRSHPIHVSAFFPSNDSEQQTERITTRLTDIPDPCMQTIVCHLNSYSRLSLFRTCTGLAYAVATHACSMRFKPGQHSTAAGHAFNKHLIAQNRNLHLCLMTSGHVQHYGQQSWRRLTVHSGFCTDGSIWEQMPKTCLADVRNLGLISAANYNRWKGPNWQYRFRCSQQQCTDMWRAAECTVSIVCMYEECTEQVIRALPAAFTQKVTALLLSPGLEKYAQGFKAVVCRELLHSFAYEDRGEVILWVTTSTDKDWATDEPSTLALDHNRPAELAWMERARGLRIKSYWAIKFPIDPVTLPTVNKKQPRRLFGFIFPGQRRLKMEPGQHIWREVEWKGIHPTLKAGLGVITVVAACIFRPRSQPAPPPPPPPPPPQFNISCVAGTLLFAIMYIPVLTFFGY